MSIVRTIVSNEVDILLLRRKIAEARIETGTLSVSGSYDLDLCFKFHLAPGDPVDLGILMDVGPENAPVVGRWLTEGFGREPIDMLRDALDGALAPDAVRSPPDGIVLAVLGMASLLVGEDEEARVVVRCPTPWAPAHVMVGRDETTPDGSRFGYRLHVPDTTERRLLAALPTGTHLRTDQWSTSLNAIDVEYEPGALDHMTRLRALSAWASWTDRPSGDERRQ